MLTKYQIQIQDEIFEVTSEHIRNWDQILCAYSRKEHNGVVRSFSSKFEFVGFAYDLLFNLYTRYGVRASATLKILTLTDNWEWESRFEAPLDFSTVTWDGYVLSIAAIDNSLASLIAARKNTKFEFIIGKDIIPDEILQYDRVVMQNSVVHEIMSNADDSRYTDGSVALNMASNFKRMPVYTVGNAESYENSPFSFEDQTEDDGACFLKVENENAEVCLKIDITYDGQKGDPFSILQSAEIHLMQFDSSNPSYNNNYIDLGTVFSYAEDSFIGADRECMGCFPTLQALMDSYPDPPQNVYAIIGTGYLASEIQAVYFTPVTNGEKTEWIKGRYSIGGFRDEPIDTCITHRHIHTFTLKNPRVGSRFALMYKCAIKKGPYNTLELNFGIKSRIDTIWTSRAKTISIDALSPKKVAQAIMERICGGNLNVNVHISDEDSRLPATYLLAAESIRGLSNAKIYSTFNDFCEWLHVVFGYTYYLGERVKGANDALDSQDIFFVHRKMLFSGNNKVTVENIRDFKYSVDSSIIYSSIEVGYEKQDYETECGRDEWNFTSSYTTGFDISDKTLSLKSKYRADCYGLEFLAQNRTKETADDKSDSDIFFIHSKIQETVDEDGNLSREMLLHRSSDIKGALSDSVFNGEFAPFRCLIANEGYISAMGIPLKLEFASSDGNSGIIIDGIAGDSDMELHEPLFSVGLVTFSTGDVSFPESTDSLFRIEHNGIRYSGFLSSLELRYARTEAAKYKLIVKEVES